jgi:hypothetical protein
MFEARPVRQAPPAAVLGRPGEPWAPACMSAAEYADWQRLNDLAGTLKAALPCADCPLAWAHEQARAGRCNGALSWLADG